MAAEGMTSTNALTGKSYTNPNAFAQVGHFNNPVKPIDTIRSGENTGKPTNGMWERYGDLDKDGKKQWAVGYGQTGPIKPGQTHYSDAVVQKDFRNNVGNTYDHFRSRSGKYPGFQRAPSRIQTIMQDMNYNTGNPNIKGSAGGGTPNFYNAWLNYDGSPAGKAELMKELRTHHTNDDGVKVPTQRRIDAREQLLNEQLQNPSLSYNNRAQRAIA